MKYPERDSEFRQQPVLSLPFEPHTSTMTSWLSPIAFPAAFNRLLVQFCRLSNTTTRNLAQSRPTWVAYLKRIGWHRHQDASSPGRLSSSTIFTTKDYRTGYRVCDPFFRRINSALGIVGRHKFLHYRSWFQQELAPYVKAVLRDPQIRGSRFFDSDFIE